MNHGRALGKTSELDGLKSCILQGTAQPCSCSLQALDGCVATLTWCHRPKEGDGDSGPESRMA